MRPIAGWLKRQVSPLAQWAGLLSMRLIIYISIICSAFSSAIACVGVPEYEMKEKDLENVFAHIDKSNLPVNSLTPVRLMEAYGYLTPGTLRIHYNSHKTVAGADFYYLLSCHNRKDGWICDKLEENRSIELSGPKDIVDIGETVDAKQIKNILNFVRDSIVTDEGNYIANAGEEPQLIAGPLDIGGIFKLKGSEYLVSINRGKSIIHRCSIHRVEVRRVQCGLSKCDFEITSNILSWRP